MIIINFKNYVHGEKALKLAMKIEKYLPNATLSASAVDIGYLKFHTKLTVFAQHIDNVDNNKRATGFLTSEAIITHGAKGSLINHSEHQIKIEDIAKLISKTKENKLKLIVCAPTIDFVLALLKLKNKPYAIAFEDPVLIGSGKSVTTFKSDELKKFVKIISGTGIISICGAGISTFEDVVAAREYGCKGVLIASAIADAKKPEKLLKDLQGIKF